jgi:hypothetical protein
MRKYQFEFEVEKKKYKTMDELRLHPCTKSNPTVKIWYIKGNGLKQVYKEAPLWDVVSRNY